MSPYPSARAIIQKAFPGIPDHDATEMAETGHVCSYPENTILCHEDAIEDVFYVLLEGEVSVSKMINSVERKFLKTLQPGDFFGELALIHNAPRAASVITASSVTVLEINKEDFNQFLQRNTSMAMAMIKMVSRRLRENDSMAIGDLRLKARELADAYQQLAEMEFARSEFLTTIAHELRTPLTAANGFIQMIRTGSLQGDALNAALETVTRNVQEIISLVNDILFLQEMDLILQDFRPTDLASVAGVAIEQQRKHAQQCQVGITLTVAPRLPVVAAESKALERAVTAILDNAIKFSPEGGEVRVDVLRDGPWAKVIITDHGVGIPEDAMPRIFDRFFRLDEVNGRLFRGIGLGLSIAKQVIEQHKGGVEVKSLPSQGCVFTLRLPV